MAGLKPHLQHVLNVFGDFLEIFSKWYGATVPSLSLAFARLGYVKPE
jgi:hypothetical protein